jgi:hypothetical protein
LCLAGVAALAAGAAAGAVAVVAAGAAGVAGVAAKATPTKADKTTASNFFMITPLIKLVFFEPKTFQILSRIPGQCELYHKDF